MGAVVDNVSHVVPFPFDAYAIGKNVASSTIPLLSVGRGYTIADAACLLAVGPFERASLSLSRDMHTSALHPNSCHQ
jgi:hypothetical protein